MASSRVLPAAAAWARSLWIALHRGAPALPARSAGWQGSRVGVGVPAKSWWFKEMQGS